jgi:ubiquinol-cytochrome c reductase core subunit 2
LISRVTNDGSDYSPAYELNELVIDIFKFRQQAFLSTPEKVALDAAHGVAFHRGIGDGIVTNPSIPFEQYLTAEAVSEFAKGAYAKPNIAIVATGPDSAELSRWIPQFFADLPSSAGSGQFKPKEKVQSKYYGGEQRIPSKAGNAVVFAFPGSSAFGTSGYKPEAAVLAALLGGESSIKWASGFSLLSKATEGFSRVHVSTENYAYSDAGLFTITVSGKVDQVAAACKDAINSVKKVAVGEVSSEDIKKAIALAKFRALEATQTLELAGYAIVNGGKPYQPGEISQGFDKVTEQQVKTVCLTPLY